MSNKIINITSLERFLANIKNYIAGILNTKQDTLVSGSNIKTINGESIIGEGNISIESGRPGANVGAIEPDSTIDDIEYNNTYIQSIEQNLSTAEQQQARTNINAQELLVSGTNIKTINGYSLLGSGNITIDGYGGSIESSYVLPAATTSVRGGIKIGSGVIVTNTDTLNVKGNNARGIKVTADGVECYIGSGLKFGVEGTIETNLKTINGQNIFGSGNITIGHKTLTTTTATSIELSPNIYYRKTNTSSTLSITLGAVTDAYILNEYFIEFTTASYGTTVSLPYTIKWANGETPIFENNCTYQISIINNLGVCVKYK